MNRNDDDRFRIRPGAPRQRGDAFISQVLRQTSKAGAKVATAGKRPGARLGRGHVAARFTGASPRAGSRRVTIKTRLVRLAKAGARSTSTHLRYIEREGVGREGEPGKAYGPTTDDADLAEDFLKYIFRALLNERADDIAFFQQRVDKGCIERLEKFVEASFERMDYSDAIAQLEKAVADGHKFEFPVKWGMDLQSEHERWLTEEHIGRPVVVMNYPKGIKAFYMRMNDDNETVSAMDILFPAIGEIVGGSQREDRLDKLQERMNEMDVDQKELWWYLESRKFGTCIHSGFGLGFERLVMFVTGMKNIRDVIPFPRTPQNAEF